MNTNHDDIIAKVQAGDLFLLTKEEMTLLLPFLKEAAADRPKGPDNSDTCQLLSRIFRLGARLYGTPPSTPDHCICEG